MPDRLWPGPGAQRARFPGRICSTVPKHGSLRKRSAPIFTADLSAALERSGRSFHAVPGPAAAAIQTSVCCARSEVAPPLAGARWLKGRDIRKAAGGVTAEFRGSRDRTQGGTYRIGRRPVKLPEFRAGNRARWAPGPGQERSATCFPKLSFDGPLHSGTGRADDGCWSA